MNAEHPDAPAPTSSLHSSLPSVSASPSENGSDVDLLTRYLNGENVTDLAKEHGVCRRTLYQYLFGGKSAGEHEALVTQALIARIADADGLMESASDKLSIMRAREIQRFTRTDLERRRPNLYSPQLHSSEDKKLTIIVKRDIDPKIISLPVQNSPENQENRERS